MTDFLLELRSEEIPARMQAKAREDLAKLFAAELAKAGLTAAETITYATPRRLALIAKGLPDATEHGFEEIKGPKASAPTQAIDGFLKKTRTSFSQLVERDGILYAGIDWPSQPTLTILSEIIFTVVHRFPWPKSMRWGDASISTESLRWVRPLQGIVALFGDAIVPCEIAGVTSGAATVGHRFHHPGIITIGSAGDYVEKLRACHVIVDQDERAGIIAMGATMLTAKAGLTLIRDDGLLAENAGLTEWPVPLLGRFDPDFLSVPPEVIQLTARVNQKYFVCHDADGKLANAFVCVANIDAADGGALIVEGNRKVLAARLSDARFFYETDLKIPLEDQAKKLDKIVFHEKLGTVADKVDRVAKLARWLVEEEVVTEKPSPLRGESWERGGGLTETGARGEAPLPTLSPTGRGLADLAYRAARLAKADLVTGMVGEFPELQGIMGGYYAAAQGKDPQVAAAIRDHYKPVGQGDDVPTDPVTVAVSLADKLDTLAGFFAINERPTGSKDPFALRRSALAILSLIQCTGIKMPVIETVIEAAHRLPIEPKSLDTLPAEERELVEYFGQQVASDPRTVAGLLLSRDLTEFIVGRLQATLLAEGKRPDFVRAALMTGTNDFLSLTARANALQAFISAPDGANLLAGYKRAANILKKENHIAPAQAGAAMLPQESPGHDAALASSGATQIPLSYTPEPAEKALIEALDSAEPTARAAVESEDFEAAMAALATLRAPIDAFFETVTVNDDDPAKRQSRLALLARVRAAVHNVADFSKIEG